MSSKTIVAIEDSDEDFAALARIMRQFSLDIEVRRFIDGDEALDYLYRTGSYTTLKNAPPPALILMDLNLPGTDGRDIIHQIKQEDQLKTIPIIVLTTSSNPKDVEICYHYGANSYVLKPMGAQELKRTIRDLFHYWFETTLLPTAASLS
ncbi:two-component system response regulator [Leptolyngbya sp. 'hensonii']|uniref:response regulator n=1 Tax=Leptolyngbya sp. 'hensonii' TaxID=1922337 RepID=UPI00094FBABF|nr:response regulator [Leptolyngbya sp. 'hensonii']OLP19643.1 two-component system response regulator [Leptolyngbya sp. 'hensonii']